MQLQIGSVYADKYRIVRPLGEGAMGAVYEAENVRIRRRVAIKALHPHVAEKQDTIRRFEREAQAAGRIGSQHIVEVLDLGELSDGTRFMVMEFLEGTTLDKRIRSQGRLTPEQATPIVCQILNGLGAAHTAGIIHRDLKPANIFLAPRGGTDFVKILDFGVSKFSVLNNEEMSMTSTGAVLGTPYYMSPEQAKGSKDIDHRSDLYAVGVILYECISGQVPFSAETFNELLFRIVLESPPPIESFSPYLDPAFIAIVNRGMAREAGARFQTAKEFADTLQQWLTRANQTPSVGGGMPLALGGTMIMDGAGGLPPKGLDDAATLMRDPPKHGPATVPLPVFPGPAAGAPAQPLPAAGAPAYPAPAAQAPGFPAPGFPEAPAQAPADPNAGGPVAAPPIPGIDVPLTIPTQRSPLIPFLLGLFGVLVVGGAVLFMLRWSAAKTATPTAASATATATPARTAPSSAPAAPPAPTSTASAEPEPAASAAPAASSAPAEAPAAPEPVAARQASGPAPGPAPARGASKAPSGARKGGAATAPTSGGKGGRRTISTEL